MILALDPGEFGFDQFPALAPFLELFTQPFLRIDGDLNVCGIGIKRGVIGEEALLERDVLNHG
ncbi:hypothetical protein D3C84_1316050 [compost metagenome]